MLFLIKALGSAHLTTSFDASANHRVHIFDRPGENLSASGLNVLTEQCRVVARSSLGGVDLDYGLFAPNSKAWSRSIITLVTRRSDGIPVAFNAMPLLEVSRGGRTERVLHLGLVIVDPHERSAGLSWILYGLTCFAGSVRANAHD